jgi:hypothetical protein
VKADGNASPAKAQGSRRRNEDGGKLKMERRKLKVVPTSDFPLSTFDF